MDSTLEAINVVFALVPDGGILVGRDEPADRFEWLEFPDIDRPYFSDEEQSEG